MSRGLIAFGLLLIGCWIARFDSFAAADENADYYLSQVKPLLKAKCYACHGAGQQEAELRLDTGELIRIGGDSGPAIDSIDVAASRLLERVTSTDESDRMPPEGAALSQEQVEILTRWIRNGGHSPHDELAMLDPASHWAFQPLRTVGPPAGTSDDPIDAFIQARLSASGIAMAQRADARTLIRRFYFDLHGLPPTSNEIHQFEKDYGKDPDLAISNLIDRLLESPRYGERWAQHWLDLVRYADTHGFEVNTPRPNAWPYRDYVIRAFNEDKPYDEFVFEQLAGDTVDEDAATGFLVAAAVLLPGQIGKDEASKRLARQDALDEMIVGTSATFLGLTVGCARCHDHKFDPISQRDYYAMQAFFAGVDYGDRPMHDANQKQRDTELARIATNIADLNKQLQQFEPLAYTGKTILIDAEGESRASALAGKNGQGAKRPGPDRDDRLAKLHLRRPVDPAGNVERFSPVDARFVRFTTAATSNNNKYEPCIDELEVFTAGRSPKNIALASYGTHATSSGNRAETGKHQLKHINDGKQGNSYSWISNEKGRGWVQLEFPQTETINFILWARDGKGRFNDRLPVEYQIEVSLDGVDWILVASSSDRAPHGTPSDKTQWLSRNAPANVDVKRLVDELTRLKKQKAQLDQPRLVYAGIMRSPDKTQVLLRGDPEQPIEEISPCTPKLFGGIPVVSEQEQDRRVKLAEWITDPENPLTSRVIANRVWQYHFGRGLVETASDFGLNGTPSSHPELLDWLARELIDNGWSLKHLHRLILSSATYQQSSVIDSRAQTIDADCRLLWRFPTRRLEAEAIRDSILSVNGQLNLEMGGPGFDFFKTRGGLSGFPPLEKFDRQSLRRMIYAHKVRMESVPVFGAFDCPDAGQPTPKRSQSTTAIQALNLFNSPFVIEQSKRFAELVVSEAGDAVDDQVQQVFKIALGRKPTSAEQADSSRVAREHGLSVVCRVIFNSNEFLFIP